MPRQYVIQPGDSLDGLAMEFYGQSSVSVKLAEFNGLRNPDQIRPHQHIMIPSFIELTGNEDLSAIKNRPPHGLSEITERFGNIFDYIRENGTLYWKWENDFMTQCDIPFSIPLSVNPARSIRSVYCHRDIVPIVSAVFENLFRRGLWKEIKSYGACFQFGYELFTGKLTPHSWGIAIDLNVESNVVGTEGDMHPEVVEIFLEQGFSWGGDRSGRFKDPMHFQYCTGY